MAEKPTLVNSVRLPHSTVAVLVHYYESKGVHVDSIAEICRVALEDYAAALIHQRLSREFTISDAVTRIAHLRNQPSRRNELRKQLVAQVSAELFDQEIPMPDDQEQVREVMRQMLETEATVQNTPKGE